MASSAPGIHFWRNTKPTSVLVFLASDWVMVVSRITRPSSVNMGVPSRLRNATRPLALQMTALTSLVVMVIVESVSVVS